MCFDLILATGGALLSGAGAIQGGDAQARSMRLQAIQAQRNADNALAKGAFDAQRVQDRNDMMLAGQLGSVTSRNLDPTYGSPLAVSALSAMQGETDVMLTRASAQQDAAASQWQVAGLMGKAQDVQKGAALSAGASLLSSIAPWASLRGGKSAPTLAAQGKGATPLNITPQMPQVSDFNGSPWGHY